MESDFYYYWHALFTVNDAYSFKVTLHRYMHILTTHGMISPKYCMYESVIEFILDYLEAHTNGTNYAYIGEGVSLPYEHPGSLDYLVHTAMNAVYRLLHITRTILAYHYSIEDYLSVFSSLYGDETFMGSQSFTKRLVLKELLKRIEGFDLEALLKEYKFF